MNNKSIFSNNIVMITCSIFVIGGAAALLLRSDNAAPQEQAQGQTQGQKNYDTFAQCLTEKQVTMYGSVNCVHCQNTKKLFGTSFQYINYVECTQDPKKCLDAGIESYPTWTFANGERLVGEQSMQILSEKSGCELP